MGNFHAKDGWFFRREDDGSVHIEKRTNDRIIAEVTLDPDTWGSVVAFVCSEGENIHTFEKARRLHDDPKHLARISVTHGPDPGEPFDSWPDDQLGGKVSDE